MRIYLNIYMITTMTTATTVWLLLLVTETGLISLQSVHATPEACEAARETYKASPYYTVRCEAKERLR
jgi:hypothetical protein